METKIYRTPKTIKAVVELENCICAGSIATNPGMTVTSAQQEYKEINAQNGFVGSTEGDEFNITWEEKL